MANQARGYTRNKGKVLLVGLFVLLFLWSPVNQLYLHLWMTLDKTCNPLHGNICPLLRIEAGEEQDGPAIRLNIPLVGSELLYVYWSRRKNSIRSNSPYTG